MDDNTMNQSNNASQATPGPDAPAVAGTIGPAVAAPDMSRVVANIKSLCKSTTLGVARGFVQAAEANGGKQAAVGAVMPLCDRFTNSVIRATVEYVLGDLYDKLVASVK